MQDIHSLASGAGGGRLYGGGGDEILRPHNNLNHPQSPKCPRCESPNTKFCYYNNYNLSQPRHYCKGCRRYWTKGGILRNVPIGGDCRKNKRSAKPKQPSSPPSAVAARKSSSHSSNESSSLTVTTTTAAAKTEAISGGKLFSFTPESRSLIPQTTKPGLVFPGMGAFTSLMTSSNNKETAPLGFNVDDISWLQNQDQVQLGDDESSNKQQQDMTSAGYLDQTAQIDCSGSENRIGNGGLAGVNWQAVGDEDQGMLDVTGTVDQGYWSSQTQWVDQHSLHYLP